MDSKELMDPPQDQQATILDRLPFNLTQLLAFAMKKPRNQMAAMDDALEQLRAMPQFASKAFYSIPFKKRNSDGTYSEEIVEGPSIKAATALTGCWGNNVEGGFLGQETDEYVDTFGYFFDYETGKLTIRPWRVSKTYRSQKGEVQKWRYDMLLKQIQAGVSKAIRNADLNGLPAGYVAQYYAEAKRISARGGKLPAKTGNGHTAKEDVRAISTQIEKSMDQLESMGVHRSEVQAYIGRHRELDSEEAVSSHLIGLLNAIEDQQTTIEEAFSAPEVKVPEPQRANSRPVTTHAENHVPVAAASAPPVQATFPDPKHALPSDRKRMQSRFSGARCPICKFEIKAGDWIYSTGDGKWRHELGPTGTPC